MKEGPEPRALRSFLETTPPLELRPPARAETLAQTARDMKSLCSGRLSPTQSLEAFFKLLRLTQLDRQSMHRERFWRRYLAAGYIQQSWLILASEASSIARHELELKRHQYAELTPSRRVDDKHAVLLMRMDHLVIAEWSHIGKCRVWYQNSLYAPALFKKSYRRDELIDFADYIQQHYFAIKGLWQKDMAAWISMKAHIPALT